MTDWHSYVAGFFDGEGSVTIARLSVDGRSDYHCIKVALSQRIKHREVIDRIHAEFGGTVLVKIQKNRLSEIWAQQVCLQIQDKPSIHKFLLAMQPHCIVKSEQIRIGLEFLESFEAASSFRDSLGRIQGKKLTIEEIERRERLRLAMRALNESGPQKQPLSSLPPLDLRHRERTEEERIGNSDTARRGENHPFARLTEDDVRAIRRAYESGVKSNTLATKYGVSRAVIVGIAQRIRWAHVPEDPALEVYID